MMHIIGAIMIALSSMAMGLIYIGGESKRLKAMQEFLQMLKSIKGELSSKLTPLPELFAALEQSSDGAARAFLKLLNQELSMLGERDFADIWEACAVKTLDTLASKEKAYFVALGRSLGRYELTQQLRELDKCIGCYEAAVADINLKLPEKKRLSLGMTCACGGLLVIVLI